ncbi:MAG: RNA polymerase sigma-70 factor [Cyclobacteriaceae bacterium]|nr:RNA polymerase sigma-70 factor [Cyclobacteriaceae bacterium]
MNKPIEERQLVIQLKDGNQASYKVLYDKYAPMLFAFSRKYLQTQEDAEEIVQEVFLRIWEKKENIDEYQSFSSYVIQAAKYRIYNGFRKKVNEQAYLDFLIYADDSSRNFTELDVNYHAVKKKAESAITAMPPKRQEIFRLSREDGLKNREIAERLQISIKTVENQMGLALKFLKDELSEYQMLIFLFLLTQTSF